MMNWLKLYIIDSVLVLTLILAIGPPVYSAQYHQLVSSASGHSSQSGSTQKKIDGIWVGVVEVSGIKVRLILRITQDSSGALTARLDVRSSEVAARHGCRRISPLPTLRARHVPRSNSR